MFIIVGWIALIVFLALLIFLIFLFGSDWYED